MEENSEIPAVDESVPSSPEITVGADSLNVEPPSPADPSSIPTDSPDITVEGASQPAEAPVAEEPSPESVPVPPAPAISIEIEEATARPSTDQPASAPAILEPKTSNLFFQFGNQEEDEEEELLELQKGREFLATYIVSESAGKFREVVLNINLNGIRVGEPKNKKRRREFDIEHILQYSSNRAQSRFTFAYLENDGVLTNYRFISKDFFEIHQTLGSAIAMMVKKKNKEIDASQSLHESRQSLEAPNPNNISPQNPLAVPSETPPITSAKSSGNIKEMDSDSPATIKKEVGAPEMDEVSPPEASVAKPEDTEADGADGEASAYATSEMATPEGDETSKEAPADTADATLPEAEPEDKTMNPTMKESYSFEHEKNENGSDDAKRDSIVAPGSRPTSTFMDNDDSSSIVTQDDDAGSQMNVDIFSEGGGSSSLRKRPSKLRRDKASFSKTIRGWNLFGPTKGTVVQGKGTKSNAELSAIDEKEAANHDSGKLKVLDYSNGKSHQRSVSSQELFVETGSRSSRTSLSNPSPADGAASAISVDTANMVIQDKELPPVEIQYDGYGREVLIKNLKDGKYDINAGTIEKLVEALAEEAPPDTIYIEVFLLTFRHFMKPDKLLEKLRDRFKQEFDDPKTGPIIKLRVVSVVKKWAERHYYDFRFPEVQEQLSLFLEDVEKAELSRYGGSIKSTVDSELERSKTFGAKEELVVPPAVQETLDRVDIVSNFTPKRIAQELTLADLKLFRLIKPDEFCLFLWGEKNDPRIANFNGYIERFNRIGFWVATVITSLKDIKKRVEAIEKFMQVIKYLYKYQNYNTLMAILSGLNTTAVSRLKKTWELVEKSRSIGSYREVEAKMSYRGNFKAYREIESHAKQPFVPFFGLYVKDLTFMNDGNQKHLAMPAMDDSGPTTGADGEPIPQRAPMINFEKCRGITDKIHAIRIYQQSTYKFEEGEKDSGGGFFSSGSTAQDEADLEVYLSHPYGPPSILDENQLLERSKACEASMRASQSSYVHGSGTSVNGGSADSRPRTVASQDSSAATTKTASSTSTSDGQSRPTSVAT